MKFWHCIIWVFIGVGWAQADPLRVVTDHCPPFQVVSKDRVVSGFSGELVLHLLERTGIEHTLEVYPWARAYRLALNQKNTMAFSTARCPDRAPLFKWAGPLYDGRSEQYLWSHSDRDDLDISSIKTAQNYSVVVTRSKLNCRYLEKEGFKVFNNLYPVVNDVHALRMLYKRRVDLMVGSKISILDAARHLNLDPSHIKPVFRLPKIGHGVYMAFNRQVDDAVVARFQTELDRFKKEAAYDRLCRKWFPQGALSFCTKNHIK